MSIGLQHSQLGEAWKGAKIACFIRLYGLEGSGSLLGALGVLCCYKDLLRSLKWTLAAGFRVRRPTSSILRFSMSNKPQVDCCRSAINVSQRNSAVTGSSCGTLPVTDDFEE